MKLGTKNYITLVEQYLKEGNAEAALSAASEPDASKDFIEIAYIISTYLTKDVSIQRPDIFKACNDIYDIISSKHDAEDIIIILVPITPKGCDSIAFVSHLKRLGNAMVHLSSKRIAMYLWGVVITKRYVDNLDLPKIVDELPDDAALVFESLFDFYNNLTENLVNVSENKRGSFQRAILKSVTYFLGEPLALLDIKQSNTLFKLVGRLVDIIVDTNINVFIFHELHLYYDIEEITKLSLSVLYYLVLAEGLGFEKVPKVYDPIYTFQFSLTFIIELCESESANCFQKAFKLLDYVLSSIRGLRLSYELLDDTSHRHLCKCLFKCMVYNVDINLRTECTRLFRKYMRSFEDRGRYLLVYNITVTMPNEPITAFMIHEYKNLLREALASDQVLPYYSGTYLSDVVSLFCNIPNTNEKSFVTQNGVVISALNLLRFLLWIDTRNRTQIWNYIPMKYLNQVRHHVNAIKPLFVHRLNEVNQTTYKRDTSLEVNVEVAGEPLVELNDEEEISSLKNALMILDLIETITTWLDEIIKSKV